MRTKNLLPALGLLGLGGLVFGVVVAGEPGTGQRPTDSANRQPLSSVTPEGQRSLSEAPSDFQVPASADGRPDVTDVDAQEARAACEANLPGPIQAVATRVEPPQWFERRQPRRLFDDTVGPPRLEPKDARSEAMNSDESRPEAKSTGGDQ